MQVLGLSITLVIRLAGYLFSVFVSHYAVENVADHQKHEENQHQRIELATGSVDRRQNENIFSNRHPQEYKQEVRLVLQQRK